MRIVGLISKGYPFLSGRPAIPQGGAQISQLDLLAGLAEVYGHECHLLTDFPGRARARFRGVRVASFRDREELWQTVEGLAPDAILGALALSCEAVRIAQHLGKPALLFPHSYEASPLPPALRRRYHLSGIEAALSPEEWSYSWRNASRVFACSRHLRHYLGGRGKPCAGVVYPEFCSARTVLPGFRPCADGLITGICGFSYKGAEMFLALARSFAEERFQLFGTVAPSLRAAFERQKNITLRPHVGLPDILSEAKIVLVPSQWPEPFGRIAVEAMANGIPVLVSATGGLVEAAPDPRLQVKAFRHVEAWDQRLAILLSDHEFRRLHGELGRKLAQRFLDGNSVRRIDRELRHLEKHAKRLPRRVQTIAFCGDNSSRTAYSLVNSELAKAASKWKTRRVITSPAPGEFRAERVDVQIHHDYAQDFKFVDFSDEGKVIAIRTWDFGIFPSAWVLKINEEVDQLWVHSGWVRDNAIQSGIPARKVRVIPLGVDDRIFHPVGDMYRLSTRKGFRFLFVGRTVVRKGIDILLSAYTKAFGPGDDVCLVIKDSSQDIFYKGIDFRKEIIKLAGDATKPEVIYLDRYFEASVLASLYRAADVGVFPYRAEGFCLPILEAMACGVPVIVPRFGACLDFCSKENSFFVPPKRISLPVSQVFDINTFGFKERVDEVDFCEVPVEILADEMRAVYASSRGDLNRRGREASNTALGSFRWVDTIERIEACLDEVTAKRIPVRLQNRRLILQRNQSLFNAAREMYLSGIPHS